MVLSVGTYHDVDDAVATVDHSDANADAVADSAEHHAGTGDSEEDS